MKELTVKVEGMMCEHCENRVNQALNGLAGVQSAKADAKGNKVDVTYDESKIDEAAIKTGIEDAGYDVVA